VADPKTEEEDLFRQKQANTIQTLYISKHKAGFPEGHTPIVLD